MKLLAKRSRATTGAEDGASSVTPDAGCRAAIVPGSGALAIAALGLTLGLGATELVVARAWDPGAVAVGPWVARPQVGSVAIDPYSRADLAHSGELPLAANEGLAFTATTDDTGYRLVRNCIYRVAGAAPAARFWTLTAGGADGRSIDLNHRSAFTSVEVVRDLEGRFTIAVAPTARPGNWLQVSGEGTLTLLLRLYDTPLAGSAGEVAAAKLPSITRQSCSASGAGPATSTKVPK
ncbi:MAG: DUF1214 domain-containing protein [Janthinobacterium lividum]